MSTDIRALEVSLLAPVQAFLEELTAPDLTFVKEDVSDPRVVQGWIDGSVRGQRWVAMQRGAVIGLVTLLRQVQWSSHVADIRLVVSPRARGHGVGTALARHAVRAALGQDLRKIVVEIVAVDEATVAMFERLGFQPEALLVDHIRDRDGELRDLLMLAFHAGDARSLAETLGLEEALG